MVMVQKYGGTSVADAGKMHTAAKRAVDLARQGIQVTKARSGGSRVTMVL